MDLFRKEDRTYAFIEWTLYKRHTVKQIWADYVRLIRIIEMQCLLAKRFEIILLS